MKFLFILLILISQTTLAKDREGRCKNHLTDLAERHFEVAGYDVTPSLVRKSRVTVEELKHILMTPIGLPVSKVASTTYEQLFSYAGKHGFMMQINQSETGKKQILDIIPFAKPSLQLEYYKTLAKLQRATFHVFRLPQAHLHYTYLFISPAVMVKLKYKHHLAPEDVTEVFKNPNWKYDLVEDTNPGHLNEDRFLMDLPMTNGRTLRISLAYKTDAIQITSAFYL